MSELPKALSVRYALSMISFFVSAFIAMFVIVDPLGTATAFAALTGQFTSSQSRAVAIKAAVIAMGVLTLFALVGESLLHHMGISLPAFRIAGGLLLFVTAFRMIMGAHDSSHLNSAQTIYTDRSHIAVFPMAIPFLAGPGCMTAAILNSSNAHDITSKIVVIAAIISVELIALICMLIASRVSRALGSGGSSLLARLMGILLAALAVQFIADGIIGLGLLHA
jgi:multiple antibiotic resistance protein